VRDTSDWAAGWLPLGLWANLTGSKFAGN